MVFGGCRKGHKATKPRRNEIRHLLSEVVMPAYVVGRSDRRDGLYIPKLKFKRKDPHKEKALGG